MQATEKYGFGDLQPRAFVTAGGRYHPLGAGISRCTPQKLKVHPGWPAGAEEPEQQRFPVSANAVFNNYPLTLVCQPPLSAFSRSGSIRGEIDRRSGCAQISPKGTLCTSLGLTATRAANHSIPSADRVLYVRRFRTKEKTTKRLNRGGRMAKSQLREL